MVGSHELFLLQVILPLDSKPGKRSGSDPSKIEKDTSVKELEGVTGESIAIRKAPDLKMAKSQLKVSSLLCPDDHGGPDVSSRLPLTCSRLGSAKSSLLVRQSVEWLGKKKANCLAKRAHKHDTSVAAVLSLDIVHFIHNQTRLQAKNKKQDQC